MKRILLLLSFLALSTLAHAEILEGDVSAVNEAAASVHLRGGSRSFQLSERTPFPVEVQTHDYPAIR